ncbi:MAG: Uncharacterized protein G01um101416_662 [Microgenomates group bacterium Gr01-1014_16]|nr:MAG: Uncharacterized protein G01um101416_662 [Microgenomates group bacterium Gr01-1014_16]
MRVDFARKFIKQLKKSPKEVKIAYVERFDLFRTDVFHPLLNNHALTGEYKGCRSFNVTGDWRVVFKEVSKDFILFAAIGTHNQLYK